VLLSTGASTLDDVRAAIAVLDAGGAGPITVLHCTSTYPTEWDEANVRAVTTLARELSLPVGISDHTPGSTVPIAAVALGAVAVEKHVTVDRGRSGPDHPFAMTLDEFGEMVAAIRDLELALGSGEKVPVAREVEKQHRMRRGRYRPGSLVPVDDEPAIWLRPEHRA
jgi:N,N'-diacetyllegionaminate synthase